MTAPASPYTASRPGPSNSGRLPMQPCAHLLDLAEACQEAAAPLLDCAAQRAKILEAHAEHPRTHRAFEQRFADDAVRANRLKMAEQMLRQLAQDADFHLFAEARAGGRVLIAQKADRTGPVIVAREDQPARPVPIVQRVRRALGRFVERAA